MSQDLTVLKPVEVKWLSFQYLVIFGKTSALYDCYFLIEEI